MSIDPEVNAMQEVILDILERLEELEAKSACCIVAEIEEKDGVLEYVED